MITKILEAREVRYYRTLELLQEGTVLCGKINYPGENKRTNESTFAFEVLLKLLEDKYNDFILHKEILSGYDGNGALMVLSIDEKKAKEIAIKIEEIHPLGRIFDIDIYKKDGDGAPISRSGLGKTERSCIVCGGSSKACTRSKEHRIEEVLDVINKTIESFRVYYED